VVRIFGFISDDKKLGTPDQQREVIGPVDAELFPADRSRMLADTGAVFRKGQGDVVIVAHARAFGRYKRGFAERQEMLEHLAKMGVAVQIGRDGKPMTFEEASAIAEFHAQALAPTGVGTPKQKRLAGRPSKYTRPEPGSKQEELALEWWAGPLHADDVGVLVGQMMGCKAVPRVTLTSPEWFGPRPKNSNRVRKPRSDKKS
jgi:hypothetical protein